MTTYKLECKNSSGKVNFQTIEFGSCFLFEFILYKKLNVVNSCNWFGSVELSTDLATICYFQPDTKVVSVKSVEISYEV